MLIVFRSTKGIRSNWTNEWYLRHLTWTRGLPRVRVTYGYVSWAAGNCATKLRSDHRNGVCNCAMERLGEKQWKTRSTERPMQSSGGRNSQTSPMFHLFRFVGPSFFLEKEETRQPLQAPTSLGPLQYMCVLIVVLAARLLELVLDYYFGPKREYGRVQKPNTFKPKKQTSYARLPSAMAATFN